MSKGKKTDNERRHPVQTFLIVCVLLAAVVGVSFAAGWISFDRTPERTTIEVDTGKVSEDMQKAAETGARVVGGAGEVLEKTGRAIEGSGKALKEADDEIETAKPKSDNGL